jgi:hypothetical protein
MYTLLRERCVCELKSPKRLGKKLNQILEFKALGLKTLAEIETKRKQRKKEKTKERN